VLLRRRDEKVSEKCEEGERDEKVRGRSSSILSVTYWL